jgi:protein-tyrosine phosphatase
VFGKILIVCIGNVCRSPMAECLLREAVADRQISVFSAGLHALAGKPMDSSSQKILGNHGHTSHPHIAHQLEKSHLQQADLVLAMEKSHIEAIHAMAPETRGRVFLIGKWQGNREIPDPYKQPESMFEHTYTLLYEAVEAWKSRLK